MTNRFTVDSDGKWWDKINHKYVNLDYLFNLVEELDNKLESKQYTINELGKTIRIYDDGYIDLNKKYKKLSEENEQLKQTMQEVAELLSEEVDLFSDKAIEHDINAYVELKELDNKDAFYMAKATKTAIRLLKGDVE